MTRPVTPQRPVLGTPPQPSRASNADERERLSVRGLASRAGSAYVFRAELDITEIDARGRPGVVWTGRACDLSRSSLTFRSRRMCYEGRELLIAVHLVDDRPVPLYCMVASCDYDGDGLYRTTVNLLPIPETDSIRTWIVGLQPRIHV